MTTVRTIINDALIDLGVVDPLETMDASMAQYGLRSLNRMLDRWSSEDLMVFSTTRTEFNLVAGQQNYTLGTGGNFNIPAPAIIDMVSILVDGTIPEVPVNIIGPEGWRALAVKNTTSSFPTDVWIQETEPLNTLSVWPIPTSSATKIVLYHGVLLGSYTDLDDVVNLPHGYEEALVSNLAVYMSSGLRAQVGPALAQRAMTSRSNIQSQNPTDWSLGETDPIAIRSFGIVVDRS